MRHEKWSCPKCDNDEFETDIFQATGGTLAKLFDVQNKKFTKFLAVGALSFRAGRKLRLLS